MKGKLNDDTLLARWLSGELSDKERAELEASEGFEEWKRIAEVSSKLKTPSWSKEQAWNSLLDKTTEGNTKKEAKIRPMRRWVYAAAAAIALLIISILVFQSDTHQTYTALAGEHKSITLPDGSIATLNAVSNLILNESEFLENRTLELDGEAFFEVEKGSKFLVKTHNGTVQVLGTSFNVLARKSNFEVACYTGKVGVSATSKPEALLNPGDQLKYNTQKGTDPQISNFTSGDSPSWKNGNSRFSGSNILVVIEELERQFDINISYPKDLITEKPYTGGFPHDDINVALSTVFGTMGLKFDINGKNVKVYR